MLCGLHWGVPLTQRSVESAAHLPDQIMLFRGPIMRLASVSSTGRTRRDRRELEGQIRITLLHEIGHHFGMNEEDLAELGYA
jgi:predicted Zn-dependent protease with MMP-like domain